MYVTDLLERQAPVAPTAPAPPIIALRGLVRRYKMGSGVVAAVDGIDLTVASGEFVALMGASGSGKSTLLSLLGGLDQPTAGEIWVNGLNLSGARKAALVEHRRRHVGFIFQSFNLLLHRTAVENVEVPLMLSGVLAPVRRARARALLVEVGLGDRGDHRPNQLSGGEQQRVAIARALANRPPIILADEPTGNLDSATGGSVMALLRDLNAAGLTLVVVTHDATVAAYADRIVHLRDGRIAQVEQRLGAAAFAPREPAR